MPPSPDNDFHFTFITSIRFLQAVQSEKGEVILIGNSWSGNVDEWDNDVLQIPRRNNKLGKK